MLNGPPAAGKSTLARLYADEHPLTLNLDIDRVRSLLGGWQEDPALAGQLAREIAVAAAAEHLSNGHDVVIPQLIARLDFIERLEATALASGASFCEVILLDARQNLRARYRERARAEAAAGRRDPAVSTDRTDAELAVSYDELLAVVGARPAAVILRTRTGEAALAYSGLLAALFS